MNSFSSVIATVAAPQNGAMTFSTPRKTLSPLASRPARRVDVGPDTPSKIAYLVITDETLAEDLSAAIEHSGIQARWFRSTKEYLDCRRPEVPSCLLISRQLSDKSGPDLPTIFAPGILSTDHRSFRPARYSSGVSAQSRKARMIFSRFPS